MRKTPIAAMIGALALAGALAAPVLPAALAAPASAVPASAAPADANDATATTIAPPPKHVPQAASRPGDGGSAVNQHDGICHQYGNGFGDLCLWYFQNFTGSLIDLFVNDCDLSDVRFVTPGAGQGQIVSNNAESDWNYDLVHTARVWTGANCTGTWGDVAPGTGGNLNPTFRNNVEGFYFY